MRCIFCKNNSDTSRSVEHIIPESLGNTTQVLRPGIVCDQCNNYFSRKVEKPLLDAPGVMSLRFQQAIPSKKGVIPPIVGMLDPGLPVELYRYLKGPFVGSIGVTPESLKQILTSDRGLIRFPVDNTPPTDIIISRFLAKTAVEALAQRFAEYDGGIDYIVDETQFDLIRDHARRGATPKWPHSARQIYDANKTWKNGETEPFQVVHEYDFLQTAAGELYFVLAIFGLELAINVGGPDIKGYFEWLKKHNQISSLYYEKNEGFLDCE